MFCHGNIFEKFLNVLVKRCLDLLTLLGVLCTTKSTRSFFSGFVDRHSLISCVE